MISETHFRPGNKILYKGEEKTLTAGDFPCLKYSEVEGIPVTRMLLEEYGFENGFEGFWVISLNHAGMYLGFYAGQYDKMSLLQKKVNQKTFQWELSERIDFGSNNPGYLHKLQNLFFELSGGEELKKRN